MVDSVTQKLLSYKFELGLGAFGESGTNTVQVDGLRSTAKIVKAGGNSMGQAQIDIWGMTPSLMKQLSTLGQIITRVRKNTITVLAGDTGPNALGTVYVGNILNAWIDFQSAPQIVFHVEAAVALFEAIAPSPVRSYSGTATVASIMQNIAEQVGWQFENNGVDVVLSNPYFWGSARNQAISCVKAANIEWNGVDNNILAIWPRGGSRLGGLIPTITKDDGMVLYPTFNSKGITVRTVYQPGLTYGQRINVQSSEDALAPANGEWIIYSLTYDLASQMPNGEWFVTMECARPGILALS